MEVSLAGSGGGNGCPAVSVVGFGAAAVQTEAGILERGSTVGGIVLLGSHFVFLAGLGLFLGLCP